MKCPKCQMECKKAGKRPDGLQRFRCPKCSKTFSEHKDQSNLFGSKQAVDDSRALLVLQLLCEGNSIRSVERLTKTHRDTIMKLLVKAGERCQALLTSKIHNVPVADVQCDEIWTYVRKKQSRRVLGDKDYHYIGDAWVFIGVERNSKLVLAFEVGQRTVTSACKFMASLAKATSAAQKFQLSTDGFAAYNYAVGTELDERVDYGQLVKVYAAPTAEEQRRYSPAHVVEAHATPVYGDPNPDQICTSHIERQNGSLRQWCKRLTRLTYAFSKKWIT